MIKNYRKDELYLAKNKNTNRYKNRFLGFWGLS